MHASPSGMGREAMRPKPHDRTSVGEGPKPKRVQNSKTKLQRKHRVRKFTKKLRRQS